MSVFKITTFTSLAALMLLAPSLARAAASPQALTPDSAAAFALLHNAGLQGQLARLGISQADLASAGAWKNPSLEAQVRGSNHEARGANVEIAVGVDVADWFLRPLRRKLATGAMHATQAEIADAVRQLVAETKTAAYQLQAQMQTLAQVDLLRDASTAAADFATQQHDAGNITERAWREQQAAQGEARLAAARLRAEIRASRETLNRLLGLSGAQTDWQMAAQLPRVPATEPPLGDVEATALARRSDLEASRTQVSLADTAVALQSKARLIPDGVTVGLDYERESDGTQLIGPRVAIPLPVFNSGRPAIERRRAEQRQAQAEFTERENAIRAEARTARDALLSAREAALIYRDELLPQRAAITKAAQREYNGMLIGVYDLLQIRRAELADERAGIEATRDYWLARVRLESVLGSANPPSLNPSKP